MASAFAEREVDVVVLGGGPGGIMAALRCAELGRQVLLADERLQLGGACLHEGCVPSRAMGDAVEMCTAVREARRLGLQFHELRFDRLALRGHAESVKASLFQGLDELARCRDIEVVCGHARFKGPRSLLVEGQDGLRIGFQRCIIATGSRPAVPLWRDLPLWSYREALALEDVPERLAVLGGGFAGLELAQLYAGLGCRTWIVGLDQRELQGVDPELVEHALAASRPRFEEVLEQVRVADIQRSPEGYLLQLEQGTRRRQLEADQVLVCGPRIPNTDGLDLQRTGVVLEPQGRIPTDERCRTARAGIYAVGDVTPGPQLAHRAAWEGLRAAEDIAGAEQGSAPFPSAIFTDPEIAWVGLDEPEAKRRGLSLEVRRYPLGAPGQGGSPGPGAGLVKLLSCPQSKRLLGVGLVGPRASEHMAEAALAIKTGARAEDLRVSVSPLPIFFRALAGAQAQLPSA